MKRVISILIVILFGCFGSVLFFMAGTVQQHGYSYASSTWAIVGVACGSIVGAGLVFGILRPVITFPLIGAILFLTIGRAAVCDGTYIALPIFGAIVGLLAAFASVGGRAVYKQLSHRRPTVHGRNAESLSP